MYQQIDDPQARLKRSLSTGLNLWRIVYIAGLAWLLLLNWIVPFHPPFWLLLISIAAIIVGLVKAHGIKHTLWALSQIDPAMVNRYVANPAEPPLTYATPSPTTQVAPLPSAVTATGAPAVSGYDAMVAAAARDVATSPELFKGAEAELNSLFANYDQG